jgi:aldose 1-epimerase
VLCIYWISWIPFRHYIEYGAVSDKDTVINLTSHTYYNLNGHGNGEITNHFLKLYSDKITPTDKEQIPTGSVSAVNNTPFDFREFKGG